jgi:hypothetical protein
MPNNSRSYRVILLFIIFFMLAGGECNGYMLFFPIPGGAYAKARKPWVPAPEIVFNEKKSFSIHCPLGWMFLYQDQENTVLSKDGPKIQVIGLKKSPYKDAFKHIKKDISDELLTTELMELFLADMHSANPDINLTIIQKSPAIIDGKDGFKIQLEYTGTLDVIYDEMLYGFIDNGYYYRIYYFAPKLYYFERDLPTFESIVKSFKRLTSPEPNAEPNAEPNGTKWDVLGPPVTP